MSPLNPVLQSPTPRPIRRRAGRGSLVRLSWPFLLLLALIWLGVFFFLLSSLRILLWGATTQAVVTQRLAQKNSKGGSFKIWYRLATPGSDPAEVKEKSMFSLSVTKAQYDALQVGARFPVRVADAMAPLESQNVPIFDGKPSSDFYVPFFIIAVSGIVLGSFCYQEIVHPLLTRDLVRNGIATEGEIGRITRGKSSWNIEYRFQDDRNQARTAWMTTSESLLEMGQTVNVLFFPRGKRFSAIYELLDDEVLELLPAADAAPSQRPTSGVSLSDATPRPVKLRSGRSLGSIGCFPLMLLLISYSFWTSGRELRRVWTQGENFPATVIFKTVDQSGCHIRFLWTPGKRELNTPHDTNAEACAQLHEGQTITVRALLNDKGFTSYPQIVQPPLNSPNDPNYGTPTALFIAIATLLGVGASFVGPQFRRALIIGGRVIGAQVVGGERDLKTGAFVLDVRWSTNFIPAHGARVVVPGPAVPAAWLEELPAHVNLFPTRWARQGFILYEASEWEVLNQN